MPSFTPDLSKSPDQRITISADSNLLQPVNYNTQGNTRWRIYVIQSTGGGHALIPDETYVFSGGSLGDETSEDAKMVAADCLTTKDGVTLLTNFQTGLPPV